MRTTALSLVVNSALFALFEIIQAASKKYSLLLFRATKLHRYAQHEDRKFCKKIQIQKFVVKKFIGFSNASFTFSSMYLGPIFELQQLT